MKTKQSFAIGDRVAMSAKFLRNIMDFSHASASKRGTVTKIMPIGMNDRHLISIKWDGMTDERNVLDCNLIHANRIHLEAH